ncbi:AMP-binding protein [Immundisolibacter sp.]|uniref:AMP-binding protein n=1 Tax=Immundisolibacter sp. TaxID=1934948 RepID=UPI002604DC6E|nr:AMP-binding protein [Immundisolibacter sp.]MDD3651867.1 AMP-binding protein [Immundisolibacter sp.]
MPGVCDPILSPERVAAMTAAGLWRDELLTDLLDALADRHPDRLAVVDHNSMSGVATRLSYLQLQHRVDRMALGLVGLGVQPGDVVAFQLPNWWQFIALHLACLRVGAVSNPLMPIFRERELRFMLDFARARLVVVPRSFRGHDYPAMLAGLRGRLPALEHVLVVGGEGEDGFERTLLETRWEDDFDRETEFARRRPDPNDVIQLLYTSGTTGQPKGVMHTSNTLLAGVRAYADGIGLSGADVCFMASPLAHQTGFMYGLMLPVVLGTRVVLQDVWDAARAWDTIQTERVTFSMGATPFLADLTNAPNAPAPADCRLKQFVCAGAPIPRVLVQNATEKFGLGVIAAWGMSECGVVTMTRPDDAPEKVFGSDGRALHGMAVRVVDAAGQPVPPGAEGTLETRGSCLFVGYLKRPDAYDVDAEGWFDTGDLARMDEGGYIRITGRAKDIIIRGGENIPVAEVEDLLYRHPAVQDAAIVAMPDARLGERACAFVTLKPGAAFDFDTLTAWLAQSGTSRTYWPERLEIVPELPRTASGKIQKFELRERARHFD